MWRPVLDRIVAEEAVLALVEIKKQTNALFGDGPEHTIVLDIFLPVVVLLVLLNSTRSRTDYGRGGAFKWTVYC